MSVAHAFAQARARRVPLLLYWGATWCPPCNRVKSEIFAHDDVIDRLQSLEFFHLDGDSAGAQALAVRYRLRSYPTLVLYAPDGTEITRLPCELDGEGFVAALDNALAVHGAASNAAQALAAALSGSRPLGAHEWPLLGAYSWDTDEGALLGDRSAATVLRALAAASAAASASAAGARLQLHAQLACAGKETDPVADGNALLAIVSDAQLARQTMDILLNHGLPLIKFASRREEVAAALNAVAAQWADDMWLGAPDRLAAVRLQMRLARLLGPAQGLQERVQERVTAALQEATDPYQRHTLVNTAVSALNDAGLAAQAEQVLRDELPRSHAPYYFMLSLAAAAKRRGDGAGVLEWYGKAYRSAVGPATRLQWGVTYLNAVLEWAPQQAEQVARELMADIAAAGEDAYQQRNLAQLRKLKGREVGAALSEVLQQV
jgi:thiol-disulfide isomerase/thioredoxin